MNTDRFYTYVGLNEARKHVTLYVDLLHVAAVHVLPEGVVYLEGESLNWTLRPSLDAIAPLVEQWMRAKGATS